MSPISRGATTMTSVAAVAPGCGVFASAAAVVLDGAALALALASPFVAEEAAASSSSDAIVVFDAAYFLVMTRSHAREGRFLDFGKKLCVQRVRPQISSRVKYLHQHSCM